MRINLSPLKPTVTAEIYNLLDMNVLVSPAANSTITVEWTISSKEDVKNGSAIFEAWGLGPVTGADASAEFDRQVSHLRFTATVGSGVVEYLNMGAA